MKWIARGHYWQRECGRYTVDCVLVPGTLTGRRYTAWRRATDRDGMASNLGCFDYRADAIDACARDLRATAVSSRAA